MLTNRQTVRTDGFRITHISSDPEVKREKGEKTIDTARSFWQNSAQTLTSRSFNPASSTMMKSKVSIGGDRGNIKIIDQMPDREKNEDENDLLNVENWVDMKKMSGRMKIDDILLLARKSKPEDTRQEEKIFMPKLNVRMVDSIMRHTSQPRTFAKKEMLTIMDLQRSQAQGREHDKKPEDLVVERIHFEISQQMLHLLSDGEKCQELLRSIVINKIEKEIAVYKSMPSQKDRQKHLELFIKDFIGNYEALRKYFTNPQHDSFIENNLLQLVTKDSLDEIEKAKKKRDQTDFHKEIAIKNYESIRNDISSRLTMLEAYHAIDKLIAESEQKIEKYSKEKIECSIKIMNYCQDVQKRESFKSDGLPDSETPMAQLFLVSQRKRLDFGKKVQPNAFPGSAVDMSNYHKLRLVQLREPFKVACDKVEAETKNLEALILKKTKLRNKLLDVYRFLLRNPQMILNVESTLLQTMVQLMDVGEVVGPDHLGGPFNNDERQFMIECAELELKWRRGRREQASPEPVMKKKRTQKLQPVHGLVNEVCTFPDPNELVSLACRFKDQMKRSTIKEPALNTYSTMAVEAVQQQRIRPLEEVDSITDPELFVYYEKQIIGKFLHAMRLKLASMSDAEIITTIEEFKRKFTQYFKVKKLDWMATTLNDKEKLRYYYTLSLHNKQ